MVQLTKNHRRENKVIRFITFLDLKASKVKEAIRFFMN